MAADDINIKATLDDEISPKLKNISTSIEKMGDDAKKAYIPLSQLLGQPQVKAMQNVAKESEKAAIGISNVGTAAQKGNSAFLDMGKAIGVAVKGFIALEAAKIATGFITAAYKEFKEGELAANKLSTALGVSSDALVKQADSLQYLSKYEDDQIVSAQAMLANYVKSESAVKALTPAILDFAEATGQDLNSAAMQVAKAISDDSGELGRYKIAITGAAGSSERAASVMAGLESKFAGQAKTAHDSSAAIDDLGKAWKGILQSIGENIGPTVDFWAKAFATGLKTLQEEAASARIALHSVFGDNVISLTKTEETKKQIAELTKQMQALKDVGQFEAAGKLSDQIDAIGKSAEKAASVANPFSDLGNGGKETSEEKYKRQKAAFDKQQGLVKEGEDIYNRAVVNAINSENEKTAALSKSLDEQVEIRKKAAEDIKSLDEELAENAKLLAEAEATSAQKAADEKVKQHQRAAQGAWDAGGMVMQSMIDVARASNASAKEMQNLQIALAVMNGASAVMSIWSQAGQLGPIAGPIVAGVETAAIIAMTAAQIAIISEQKFATGGIISGPSSGDMVSVRGNGGEAVMTTSQQKRLLAIADGAGNGGTSITIAPQVRVDSGMSASEKRRIINATANTTRAALKQLSRTNRLPAGMVFA